MLTTVKLNILVYLSKKNAVPVSGKQFRYQKYQHLRNNFLTALITVCFHMASLFQLLHLHRQLCLLPLPESRCSGRPPHLGCFVPSRHWKAGNVAPWWRCGLFGFVFFFNVVLDNRRVRLSPMHTVMKQRPQSAVAVCPEAQTHFASMS